MAVKKVMSNKEFVKQTQMERFNPITNRGVSSSAPPQTMGKKKYAASMDKTVQERASKQMRPSVYMDIAEDSRRKYSGHAKTNNFVGAGKSLATMDAANRLEKARKTGKK